MTIEKNSSQDDNKYTINLDEYTYKSLLSFKDYLQKNDTDLMDITFSDVINTLLISLIETVKEKN